MLNCLTASTHARDGSTASSSSDTSSPVNAGESSTEMCTVDQPEPGSNTRSNGPPRLSGFPIASSRLVSEVTTPATASHRAPGRPAASSRTARTCRACRPWNATSSESAGFCPIATSWPSIRHVASSPIVPGSPSRECSRRSSPHRIADTCRPVGAVVTTRASPTGCAVTHQAASSAAVNDFDTPCPARTAVRRWSRTDAMTSRCLLHSSTP